MKKIINYLLAIFFIGIFLIPCAHAEQSKRVDVIFLGDTNSGKTWLRACLLGEDFATFDERYRSFTSKLNVAYSSITVNGNQVSLLYWDTSGLRLHDQLSSSGSQIYQFIVLTVDLLRHTLDSPAAFDKVDVVEDLLNNWLRDVGMRYPKAYIIIAGTKKDAVSPAICQSVLDRLNFFKTFGSYKGRLECILTSAIYDRASVMQIESIIKRQIESVQLPLDELPIFQLKKSSETNKGGTGCIIS